MNRSFWPVRHLVGPFRFVMEPPMLLVTEQRVERMQHRDGLPAALFAPAPASVDADFVLTHFGALRRMIAFPAKADRRAFDGPG